MQINPSTRAGSRLNHWAHLKWLSVRGLLPCLLIGMFWCQPGLGIFQVVSQISFWFAFSAAMVVILSTFRRKEWALLIILGLLLSKAGRIYVGDETVFLHLYTVFMALLFCTAGAAVALKKPRLIYKQLMLVCLLSLPLMLLQVLGVGAWTQFARTDFHGFVDREKILMPTLFVGKEDVVVSTLQFRPAGFFYANNLLSIFIMFALGLHYGRIKSSKVTWGDVVICAITVLAMAKVGVLTFAVIVLWLLVFGEYWKKIKMIKVVLFFTVLMITYAFFFPGVFAKTTSPVGMLINVAVRLHDFIWSARGEVPPTIMFYFHEQGNAKIYSFGSKSHESGYASIARGLPYLVIAVLFMLPFFLQGYKKIRQHFPELKDSIILCLFVLILMPTITSFLEGALFWFIAGFGLIPLFFIFKPVLGEIKQK